RAAPPHRLLPGRLALFAQGLRVSSLRLETRRGGGASMRNLSRWGGLWVIVYGVACAWAVQAAGPPVRGLACPLDSSPEAPNPPPATHPADKAARANCPTISEYWQFIGCFCLTDRGVDRLVTLYAEDSNVNGTGISIYPNFFSIRAAYKDDWGQWVEKAVYSSTGAQFNRVPRTREEVVVEVGSNYDTWGHYDKAMTEAVAKANQPFLVRIRFENGQLAARCTSTSPD